MNDKINEKPHATIYDLDGRPPLKAAVPLGLQHVFAMFIGNLAPIFVIAGVVSAVTGEAIVTPAQRMLMIQAVMIASGLSTLIQLYPIRLGKKVQIGAGLPIVAGYRQRRPKRQAGRKAYRLENRHTPRKRIF